MAGMDVDEAAEALARRILCRLGGEVGPNEERDVRTMCRTALEDQREAGDIDGANEVRDALHLQRVTCAAGNEQVAIFMGFNEAKGVEEWRPFWRNELTPEQWWAFTGERP